MMQNSIMIVLYLALMLQHAPSLRVLKPFVFIWVVCRNASVFCFCFLITDDLTCFICIGNPHSTYIVRDAHNCEHTAAKQKTTPTA